MPNIYIIIHFLTIKKMITYNFKTDLEKEISQKIDEEKFDFYKKIEGVSIYIYIDTKNIFSLRYKDYIGYIFFKTPLRKNFFNWSYFCRVFANSQRNK